ncbi:outer membrane beta-barrel protein [Terriglobus saanensis]|nr:outer membrane beta-barrel protein [Terriglobus saanensis]
MPIQAVETITARVNDTKSRDKNIFRIAIFLLGIGSVGSARVLGQATAAGVRKADFQVGLGVSGGPHYGGHRYYGGTFYTTFDFSQHWGIEGDIRQVDTTGDNKLYERTYQLGVRYVRHYKGFINPYGKIMVGRGVFNFANDSANLAYNIGVLGGGVDLNVTRHINVRGDFEYQHWKGFPNGALTPKMLTAGVAYHF